MPPKPNSRPAALHQVVHHRGAVVVTHQLRRNRIVDAEFLQHRFDIDAARCAVVDDRVGGEQRAFQRIRAGDVGQRRAVARHHAGADAADRDLPFRRQPAGLGQLRNDRNRRQQNLRHLAAADAPAQFRRDRILDFERMAGRIAETPAPPRSGPAASRPRSAPALQPRPRLCNTPPPAAQRRLHRTARITVPTRRLPQRTPPCPPASPAA